MRIIVYDRLTVWALISAVLLHADVRYFSASRLSRFLLHLTKPKKIRFIAWKWYEVRDSSGTMLLTPIHEELNALSEHIVQQEWVRNLAAYESDDDAAFLLFLRKQIYEKIEPLVSRIHVIGTHVLHNSKTAQAEYRIHDESYRECVQEFAKQHNIHLQSGATARLNAVVNAMRTLFLYGVFYPAFNLVTSLCNMNRAVYKDKKSLVCIEYTGTAITLDKDKKSAIFPFFYAPEYYNRVIMMFDRTISPCTESLQKDLDATGIRYCALQNAHRTSASVPKWTVNYGFFTLYARRLIRLLLFGASYMKAPPDRNTVSVCTRFALFSRLMWYSAYFSYYADYFRSMRIKAFIHFDVIAPVDMVRVNALRYAGGAALCLQTVNFEKPNTIRTMITDVLFSFGPYYTPIRRASGSAVRHELYNGYIYDYIYSEGRGHAARIRESLKKKGARYVISFFDEKIGTVISWDDFRKTTEMFADLVLQRPDIAVIHKSKFKIDRALLPERVREAIAEGRYDLRDTGIYKPEDFPGIIASASDVAVGYLYGGTALLEALLCGIPMLCYDPDNNRTLPEYGITNPRIVFNTNGELKAALLDKTVVREGMPSDYLDLVRRKDPYQDGKALQRLGEFIKTFMRDIDNGKNPHEAAEHAVCNHRNKWKVRYE